MSENKADKSNGKDSERRRLEAELKKLRREHESLSKQLALIESQNTKRREEIEKLDSSLVDLNDWVVQSQTKFIGRLSAALAAERQRAEAALAEMDGAIENVQLPAEGRISAIHLRFVKAVLAAWILPVLILLTIFLLPWLFSLPPIDFLSALYDPQSALWASIGVIAIVIAISFLVVRALNRDKFPTGKFWIWIAFLALIGYFLSQASLLSPFFQFIVIPFIQQYFWSLFFGALGVALASMFGVFALYYRDWSKFQRQVDTQLAMLSNIAYGYEQVRKENHRLAILHQQTMSWMELLSSAIFRPWKIDPKWLEENPEDYQIETRPNAVRVAQAIDNADGPMMQLDEALGQKLLVKGWRRDAFEEMIAEVARESGRSPETFNIETLDKDLPHIPNESRNLVLKFLRATAAREKTDNYDFSQTQATKNFTDLAPTDRYLKQVARRYREKLMFSAQVDALTKIELSVVPIGHKLKADQSPMRAKSDESQQPLSWGAFLSESLGTTGQPSPYNPINFTPKGLNEGSQLVQNAFIVLPNRMLPSLPRPNGDNVHLEPSNDGAVREVEIAARIELTTIGDPSHLKLFSPPEPGSDPSKLPTTQGGDTGQ